MPADKINVYNLEGAVVDTIMLNEELLTANPNKHVVFEQVVAENAALRQGTHSTLTKAEVRGGGRKPRPQKHTGNARQGSTRNPH
jgi:large subunit ribosomal protein L4